MRMAPTLTLSGLTALVHDLSAVETVNNDGTNPLSGLYPARQTSTPTKKPHARCYGASTGGALSREERIPMRRGAATWLTAHQPITVAGPRPIHTAFPASLPAN
jgi:hypothetical protein